LLFFHTLVEFSPCRAVILLPVAELAEHSTHSCRMAVACCPRFSKIDSTILRSAKRIGKLANPTGYPVWTDDNSCKAEQSVEAVRGLLQTTRLSGAPGGMCTANMILLPWCSRPAELASKAKQCESVTTQDASNVTRANESTTWSPRISSRLTCVCEHRQSSSRSEGWTKEEWGSRWMLLCF
jgi:hypothetical protein